MGDFRWAPGTPERAQKLVPFALPILSGVRREICAEVSCFDRSNRIDTAPHGSGGLAVVTGGASVMGSHRISHEPDHVVQSYIRHHIRSPESFMSHIDANDEMFLFDLQANQGNRRRTAIGYYVIGSRIFDSIKQIAAWHLQGLEHVGSFLDFACGYGRSTRFLSRELSPSRIWACDIYSEAVEFQKVHYGVNGIVSVADPADFPRDVKFDFIFASSFFTHMPETTFARWLETLYSLLTPRGILIFSTLDTSLIPSSGGARPKGICFVPISESRTLDKNQYGVTYVDEQFVTQVVDRCDAGQGTSPSNRAGFG